MIPKRLAAARLIASKNTPYLSTIIYALIPIETGHPELKTIAVDKHGRLYYNPDFIEELSVNELSTCIIHEANHILRNHYERGKGKQHEIFNIAADCEINDDLWYSRLVIPEGAIMPSMFNLNDGKTAEYYYQQIVNNSQSAKQAQALSQDSEDSSGKESNPMCGNSGSCGSGEPKDWEQKDSDPQGNDNEGSVPKISEGEMELLRDQVATEIQNTKNQGIIPDSLVRWAKEFKKPQVNWRKELSASIKNALNKKSGLVDYTYSRRSRRSLPRVILPGMDAPVPNVSVVIDTSGSMSTEELEAAVSETAGILKSMGSHCGIQVLSVDAHVNRSKKAFSVKDITLIGGGGTDMTKGIMAAASERPKPDVIVIITDGYTDWPKAELPKIKLLAVLTSDCRKPPRFIKSIKLKV